MTTQLSQLLNKHPKLIGTDSVDPVILMEHNLSDTIDDTTLEVLSTYKCFITECIRLKDRPAELNLFIDYYKTTLADAYNKYHCNLHALKEALSTNLELLDALHEEAAQLLTKGGVA